LKNSRFGRFRRGAAADTIRSIPAGKRTGEDENESMDLAGMGGLVSVDVGGGSRLEQMSKKQSCVLDTYAWFLPRVPARWASRRDGQSVGPTRSRPSEP
jgi:hypothetical protein